jgi:hypothetical protein
MREVYRTWNAVDIAWWCTAQRRAEVKLYRVVAADRNQSTGFVDTCLVPPVPGPREHSCVNLPGEILIYAAGEGASSAEHVVVEPAFCGPELPPKKPDSLADAITCNR